MPKSVLMTTSVLLPWIYSSRLKLFAETKPGLFGQPEHICDIATNDDHTDTDQDSHSSTAHHDSRHPFVRGTLLPVPLAGSVLQYLKVMVTHAECWCTTPAGTECGLFWRI
ncbi:hypothetical protein ACOMHN_024893 [Nucella lapillus]